MTLIEVLAALIVLAVVLSLTLMARTRYLHQVTRAGTQLDGIRQADALLANWWLEPDRLPRAREHFLSLAELTPKPDQVTVAINTGRGIRASGPTISVALRRLSRRGASAKPCVEVNQRLS